MDNYSYGTLPRPVFYPTEPAPKVRKENHPLDTLETSEVDFLKEESRKTSLIVFRTFFYQGEAYPLEECGQGVYHKVFSFRDSAEIIYKGQRLQTSNIVIKTYQPEPKKGKLDQTIINDRQAYELLSQMKVPLPLIYATPTKEEPFWILERICTPITGESWSYQETFDELSETDKRILNFAKIYLTKNALGFASKIGEFIGDFDPKNVMLDSVNHPVVIDPTLPEKNKWSCKDNLKRNVENWSRGNPNIVQYLIQDFPDKVKELFQVNNI